MADFLIVSSRRRRDIAVISAETTKGRLWIRNNIDHPQGDNYFYINKEYLNELTTKLTEDGIEYDERL